MVKFETIDEENFNRELERAVIIAYGGVQRKKNPMLSRTRDFGIACVVFHICMATLKLIFGYKYINKCPANEFIPHYMWLGGVLQIFFMLTILLRKKTGIWALQIVIAAVLVIWCLFATISVLFEWEPDYYITGHRYCNKVIYMFAVVVGLAEAVCVVLLVLLICIAISFEVPY